MRRPQRLWQHGDMRDARPGDNTHTLWDEAEIKRRSKGMSKQARRELERGLKRRRRTK
jgi:hypothetical protein